MSALTVADIRRFQPTLVWEARDRIEVERERISLVMAGLLASRPPASLWLGPAARSASARGAEAIEVLSEIATRLATVAQVLTDLGQRMQACLELVRHAEWCAAEGGGWITQDGQLVLPAPVACVDPALEAYRARREALLRQEVGRGLGQAVRLARQTDDEVAAWLARSGQPCGAPPLPGPGSLPIPPPPELRHGRDIDPVSAFANAAWWRALTPDEKGRAIRDHPEWVGPRDGLPGWARHEANLHLLARLEADAATALAQSQHRRYSSWFARRQDIERTTHRVQALQAVRDVISQHDGVPRQLLYVDDSGPAVQTAVAVGDVGRAEHVATYVAGFTTTVQDSLRRIDEDSKGMRAEARSITPDGGDLAVVAWLGYPAPQWSGVTTPGASVLGQELASAYSDELATFLNGLEAARDRPVHSTLWAHSYGSNLAGHALLKKLAVDDVVLLGSPGVPFRKLEATGLKPQGLNVLEAPDDVVSHFGPELFGHGAPYVSGARRLATMSVKGMPNDLRTAHGHSEYLDPGTVSRRSLVAVAAGRPDLVIPASDEEARRQRSIIIGRGPLQVTVPFD